jgi:phosphomannomutase
LLPTPPAKISIKGIHMTKHVFHPSILRAYDIRGIVDETLTLNDAKAIGIAFAACLRQRGYGNHVAVGRDGRLSSPALAAALCDGLVAGGARVSDIGCGPYTDALLCWCHPKRQRRHSSNRIA